MFPFIQLGESIIIPTYFLVISMAYMVATYWLFLRTPRFKLSQNMGLNLTLIVMVGGFVGARLFHVLWEHPDYYAQDFSLVFKFWHGGFVFYGGLVGALVPSIWYLKRNEQSLEDWMAATAPIIALGYILGRFATLLSGSGYGLPTDLPWAIVYPPGPEAPAGIPLHPTPIYSMAWNTLALFLVLWLERRPKIKVTGKMAIPFYVYGVFHGLGRLVIEQFRNDYRGGDDLWLSVSSWISIVLIIFCLWQLFRGKRINSPAA